MIAVRESGIIRVVPREFSSLKLECFGDFVFIMKKVIVIGCPGSGKSVFSRSLHELTGLPLFPLDLICWRPDRTFLPKEEKIRKVREIISKDEWIIDGNYGSTMEMRMEKCDTIIFLDYPTDVCLEGILERRGKSRPDLPWVEPSDEIDEEFIEFVKNYNTVNRPVVFERMSKFPEKEIHVFKSRDEADMFLVSLKEQM